MFALAEIRIAVSGEFVGQLADRDSALTAVGAPRFWRLRLR
jgi:hypothetical protein